MTYKKPNILCYRFAQAVTWLAAKLIFKRKILRNEIKGKKGPFLVLANHQCAYDFVNLMSAARRPMSFVISRSFYNSLPLKGFLKTLGVIPKQQFQTSAKDLKQIKAVVDAGEPVVIYPAGLMSEDGLPTPTPTATYKLLKWLDTDVYVARSSGTYFVMPKWTTGFRPGRTHLDVYKLFSKEELQALSMEQIRRKTAQALDFDAYKEQEELLVKYKKGSCVEGLENVLYMCPNCGREFTIRVRDGHTLYCTECGFAQKSDEYAFLHNESGKGAQLRYVSDWSKLIYATLKEKISRGQDTLLSAKTKFHMIDPKKNKFAEVGTGTVTLDPDAFLIEGVIHGKETSLSAPIASFASLPFSPGKYFEIQYGPDIYRCVLEDGRLAMKFINMVKIFYELKAR